MLLGYLLRNTDTASTAWIYTPVLPYRKHERFDKITLVVYLRIGSQELIDSDPTFFVQVRFSGSPGEQ